MFKFIGAIIGFFFLGKNFFGAIVGFLVGSFIDNVTVIRSKITGAGGNTDDVFKYYQQRFSSGHKINNKCFKAIRDGIDLLLEMLNTINIIAIINFRSDGHHHHHHQFCVPHNRGCSNS